METPKTPYPKVWMQDHRGRILHIELVGDVYHAMLGGKKQGIFPTIDALVTFFSQPASPQS